MTAWAWDQRLKCGEDSCGTEFDLWDLILLLQVAALQWIQLHCRAASWCDRIACWGKTTIPPTPSPSPQPWMWCQVLSMCKRVAVKENRAGKEVEVFLKHHSSSTKALWLGMFKFSSPNWSTGMHQWSNFTIPMVKSWKFSFRNIFCPWPHLL